MVICIYVYYRPVLDHLQVLRSMIASICGGLCACEPRSEASVTH